MNRLNKYLSLLIGVFLILVTSTIFAWWITKQIAIKKTNEIFVDQVITIESWITNRFELYKTIAYGLQSFWVGSEIVTAEEWNSYIKNLKTEERFPSITSFGYDKRINDDYIVTFVYPPERSTAIGFNVSAEEKRRTAINKAIDEATVTITDRILLAADQFPGFIMFIPLYRTQNIPENLAERRAATEGVAAITFQSENVFKNIFEPVDPFPSLDFELYKGKIVEDEHLLYDHDASHYIARGEKINRLETKKTIIIDKEVFTLFVVSKPSFGLRTAERNLPNIVLLGGILTSIIIFALFHQKLKHQNRLDQIEA